MNEITMQDLMPSDLDKAKLAERTIEGLITDELIIAVGHGFELPDELKGLEPHLENLRRIRLSISMAQN